MVDRFRGDIMQPQHSEFVYGTVLKPVSLLQVRVGSALLLLRLRICCRLDVGLRERGWGSTVEEEEGSAFIDGLGLAIMNVEEGASTKKWREGGGGGLQRISRVELFFVIQRHHRMC